MFNRKPLKDVIRQVNIYKERIDDKGEKHLDLHSTKFQIWMTDRFNPEGYWEDMTVHNKVIKAADRSFFCD